MIVPTPDKNAAKRMEIENAAPVQAKAAAKIVTAAKKKKKAVNKASEYCDAVAR